MSRSKIEHITEGGKKKFQEEMLLAESSALFSCSRYTFPHVCVWVAFKKKSIGQIWKQKGGNTNTKI